jgi:hypothetical protein
MLAPVEIITIYLAFGMPVGVYIFLTRKYVKDIPLRLLMMAVAVIIWPLVMLLLLSRLVSKKLHAKEFVGNFSSDSFSRDRAAVITKELEKFTASGPQTSLFEFREAADRYCGLMLEPDTLLETDRSDELFSISDHENKMLATRCLHRRYISNLARHRNAAKIEFTDVLLRTTVPEHQKEEFTGIVSSLFETLKDEDSAVRFLSRYSYDSDNTTASLRNNKPLWATDDGVLVHETR